MEQVQTILLLQHVNILTNFTLNTIFSATPGGKPILSSGPDSRRQKSVLRYKNPKQTWRKSWMFPTCCRIPNKALSYISVISSGDAIVTFSVSPSSGALRSSQNDSLMRQNSIGVIHKHKFINKWVGFRNACVLPSRPIPTFPVPYFQTICTISINS